MSNNQGGVIENGTIVIEGNRIVAELDTDLGEDTVRDLLDLHEIFLAENVVGRDIPGNVGYAELLTAVAALRAGASAAALWCGFCHLERIHRSFSPRLN